MKRTLSTSSHASCGTCSPTKRLARQTPSFHQYLLSQPPPTPHLDSLWLVCGSGGGRVTLVDAEMEVHRAEHDMPFEQFTIYNTQTNSAVLDAALNADFARNILWHAPRILGTALTAPQRLMLADMHIYKTHIELFGSFSPIKVEDEACTVFLALRTLDYNLKGWALIVEQGVQIIHGFAQFKLDRC